MRQLLRPGGRTGFLTILPADGLSRADYRRAIRCGPRAVSTRLRRHEEMLHTAGFEDVLVEDVTPLWRQTTAQYITEHERRFDELAEITGRQPLQDRQRDLRRQLRAIDDRLLRRALFVARRPR